MTNPCEHCICKTCAIAKVNGGAPGCGDCDFCKNDNYLSRCTNCGEYYNPVKINNKEARKNEQD